MSTENIPNGIQEETGNIFKKISCSYDSEDPSFLMTLFRTFKQRSKLAIRIHRINQRNCIEAEESCHKSRKLEIFKTSKQKRQKCDKNDGWTKDVDRNFLIYTEAEIATLIHLKNFTIGPLNGPSLTEASWSVHWSLGQWRMLKWKLFIMERFMVKTFCCKTNEYITTSPMNQYDSKSILPELLLLFCFRNIIRSYSHSFASRWFCLEMIPSIETPAKFTEFPGEKCANCIGIPRLHKFADSLESCVLNESSIKRVRLKERCASI